MATSTVEANTAGSDSGNQVATPAPSPAMSPRALIDMRRIQALATRASSMVEQIRGRLLAPEAKINKGYLSMMQPYNFTEEQILEIIEYIKTLGSPVAPTTPTTTTTMTQNPTTVAAGGGR